MRRNVYLEEGRLQVRYQHLALFIYLISHYICVLVHVYVYVFCVDEDMGWDEWDLDSMKWGVKSKVKVEKTFSVV